MNIVIIGAGKGIGFEITRQFLSECGNTIIAISRNIENLRKLNPKSNSILKITSFDINQQIQNQEKILAFIDFETIDILINNAAFLINKNFEDFTKVEITNTFNTNVIAPSLIIRALIPKLKKSGQAHVVNISSMAAFQGSKKFTGLSYYSASKAALATLTECLAEEYRNTKIHFNCLALGAVETEMLKEAFPGYIAPLNAEEMGKYIKNFAQNSYNYYNGKVLPVAVATP